MFLKLSLLILLYSDLFEIIKEIKSYDDTTIYLVTNGTLISKCYDDLMVHIQLIDMIYISIDSHIEKTHNLIRGSSNAFKNAIHGIKLLTKTSVDKLGINTVIMTSNFSEIAGILNLALNLGLHNINLLRLLDVADKGRLLQENLDINTFKEIYININNWMKNKLEEGYTDQFYITLVLPGYVMNEVHQERKDIIKNPYIHLESQFDPINGCPAFGKSIVMTGNGTITGCTAMIEIQNAYVGKITDDYNNVRKNWHKMIALLNERKKNLRQKEPCASCKYWRSCKGGCPASAYKYYNTIMMSDPTCIVNQSNRLQ